MFALVLLFPPMRSQGDSTMTTRGFLFSDHFYVPNWRVQGEVHAMRADIDVPRLLAECLLVVCLSGCVLAVVIPKKSE
jgi:hypothetical protein